MEEREMDMEMDMEEELQEEDLHSSNVVTDLWDQYFCGPLGLTIRPALALIALVILIWTSSDTVAQQVQSMERFETRHSLSQLQFPRWLSPYAVDQLDEISLEKNIFSPQLVPTIVYHAQKLPWVRKVVLVERGFPARISLKLSLREPVAWATIRGRKYMIDKYGYPVDARFYDKGLQLPEITGLERTKKNQSPAATLTLKLKHGSQVAHSLLEYKVLKYLEVKKIDVANVEGVKDPRSSEVILEVGPGVLLEWGRTALSENPIKISVPSKLKNLKTLLKHDPTLKKIKVARLQFEGMLPVELVPGKEKEKEKEKDR